MIRTGRHLERWGGIYPCDTAMALSGDLRQRIESILSGGDGPRDRSTRLVDDAQRVWMRVRKLAAMGLIRGAIDTETMELACLTLQLPMSALGAVTQGRLAGGKLRERAEQSAELLVATFGGEMDETLLDRTTRLLHELPQRTPMLDEAKLLADAVNLEDFGVVGMINQAMQSARQDLGVERFYEGCQSREVYAYWEARLKDGFHFEPVRELARVRLEQARQLIQLLGTELTEDGMGGEQASK